MVQVAWRIGAAAAHLRMGQRIEAVRLADEQLSLAQHFGAASAIGVALRTLGLAQGGQDGIASLTHAVATLAGSPARLEHARALVDLGSALRRAGQRSQALEPLRQVMDLATGLVQPCSPQPRINSSLPPGCDQDRSQSPAQRP